MNQIAAFIAPQDTQQDNLLKNALTAVRTHLRMPIAYLSAFEGDDVVFKEVSSDPRVDIIRVGDSRPAHGSYCQAVKDGVLPELIGNTRDFPEAMALPVTQQAPVGAVVSIPILLPDGEIYGMFCCLSPDPVPTLNERDHEVMTMFAALAANAVNESLTVGAEQTQIRNTIRDVITDRNFQVLLQPIFDLETGNVAGAEALTRFRSNPYRSPDKWFADADQVGMLHTLELATITKAFEHVKYIPKDLYLSLNCSAGLMATGVLQTLLDGPYASQIVMELTEHDNIQDIVTLQKQIKELRALGVRVAVDDLGSGYAGLTTVLQLKPDILKMDRALVRGIHLDPASQALASSLVFFAKRIGAKLIAEGIESWEECEILSALGVGNAQGFLLGKPERLNVLQSLIDDQAREDDADATATTPPLWQNAATNDPGHT